MKKIILGVALTAAASTTFAASYGPAGCGLGSSVVFPNASSLPEHVLAATTNGISGNQTFGMTLVLLVVMLAVQWLVFKATWIKTWSN